MEEIASGVLKSYGIAGLIAVSVLGFSGWIVHKIVTHFMETAGRKDQQITDISAKFVGSLDANTKALHEVSLAQIKFGDAIDTLTAGFDRTASQNRDEHGQILDFIRARRN